MGKGYFITLEGPEGCGKSTQSRKIFQALEKQDYKVIHLREPGATQTGEMIRNILQHRASGEDLSSKTELLLFEAARAQLIENVIKPHIETGGIAICDRFYDSTTAYQGYGRGMNLEIINTINNYVSEKYQPNLTLLLDLPIEKGMERVVQRSEEKDTFEKEKIDFHKRVRKGYLKIAKSNQNRISLIDATLTIEEVYQQIQKTFKEKLNLKI